MHDLDRHMGEGSDFIRFAEEDPPLEKPETAPAWKLLIVDDEEEVHGLTRLVLNDYLFEGRPLQMFSAYSGAAAQVEMRDNPGIAIVLVDVVMEEDNSGLELVRYIRESLNNQLVRIILRTGQPGQAPEHEVVARYDINDYKAKTELTSQKLFTSITSALRAYRDLLAIDRSRRGLQKVVDASGALFGYLSLQGFAASVLEQLIALVQQDSDNPQVSGLAACRNGMNYLVVAGSGKYLDATGKEVDQVLSAADTELIGKAALVGDVVIREDRFICFVPSVNGDHTNFYLESAEPWDPVDLDLIRIFSSNIAIAADNLNLHHEIIETQKEIIHTLGEVVETRSQETANHVLRVGKLSYLLARRAGLDSKVSATLRMASPMHDIGKVGIPDAILNKPGSLDKQEYSVIKQHPEIGHAILKKSFRPIMQAAATVSLQHHERWDGTGYPNGLAGEQIHIFGRITALVDVFDALCSNRVYRDALDPQKVKEYFVRERGRHFDPTLVDLFLDGFSDFMAVQQAHPDGKGLKQMAADCE